MTYFYDGSLEGFLSAVFTAYEKKEQPDFFYPTGRNTLFTEGRQIQTDLSQSERVLKGVSEKISWEAFRHCVFCFYSEEEGIEKSIYDYLVKGFCEGEKIDSNLTHPLIHKIHAVSRKVIIEIHRLKGFLRFKELKNSLFYAELSPDFNIIQFLAPHFAKRFSAIQWLIHDVKRNTCIYFNDGKWELFQMDEIKKELLSEKEKDIENLWKEYFQSTAIRERKNLRLQKQFMPKRYWKYLTEKEENE
ncbi:MAG TPA: hypothetical protein DHW82_10585 [Spirochaetia bacterium]|nr:MAG: hypothetical protein A2Y41_01240 [Spirochaetes bacterium GWB1_36_13]HCL57439.1 hypothetical protein [Spirochaetia bacterium]